MSGAGNYCRTDSAVPQSAAGAGPRSSTGLGSGGGGGHWGGGGGIPGYHWGGGGGGGGPGPESIYSRVFGPKKPENMNPQRLSINFPNLKFKDLATPYFRPSSPKPLKPKPQNPARRPQALKLPQRTYSKSYPHTAPKPEI